MPPSSAWDAEVADAHAAHEAHLQARAVLEAERGGKLRGRKPKPPPVGVVPTARANTGDPDSRLVRSPTGFVQGYNAQAVCTATQIVIAAELSTDSPDGRLLTPMLAATRHELQGIGIHEPPGVVLADGGYWNAPQIMDAVAAGSEVLVNPDTIAHMRRPAEERKLRDKRISGLYAHMQRAITSPRGHDLYRRRKQMIEPIVAQTKVIRRADQFQRRGIDACLSEWRLIAATHNILKLYRAPPAAA